MLDSRFVPSFVCIDNHPQESEWKEALRSPKEADDLRPLVAHKSGLKWPDGCLVSSVEIRDHVIGRYRERNFDDQDATDRTIRNRIASDIDRCGCFAWTLPGNDVWVLFIDDEAVAVARGQENKMIVISYYGSKQLVVWHRHQEILIRRTRKAKAAV